MPDLTIDQLLALLAESDPRRAKVDAALAETIGATDVNARAGLRQALIALLGPQRVQEARDAN